MKTRNAIIGTAATAAVGYALADGLALARTCAEDVETAEHCGAPSAHARVPVQPTPANAADSAAADSGAVPSPRTRA